MPNRAIISFLTCLVIKSVLIPNVSALSDGDCLGYAAFDIFRHSPGGYEPGQELSGKLCAGLCSGEAMPYAGLVGKDICLCAFSHDLPSIEAIEQVPSEYCDTGEDYTRFYEGRVIHPVSGLSIKTSSSEYAKAGDQIEFEIELLTGVDVKFTVDFGDGSPTTEWSETTIYKHKYYIPGDYMVAVYAKQAPELRRQIRSEYTMVKIIEEVNEDHVSFKCPKVVEPGDSAHCNLTIISGHGLETTVNFGDGNPPVKYPLPGNCVTAFRGYVSHCLRQL